MIDEKTVAIVPGSFDPITYGHIDIAKRAAKDYDIVYLAVMINDQKRYLFTLQEREEIARLALSGIENITVISSDGMLWKLAEELGADAIVKGYRNNVDYEYEMKMAEFNSRHNPKARTVLLKADQSLTTLSSTLLREKIAKSESIDAYLPKPAAYKIIDILKKRETK
ncbi:MAG: pantetheine-phosphate adenylyltransferase [Clostridia bacterium]|nr:pantetheine-phosphate adenylyltransferase [Clostridia bacterium]